jgi:predicted nucleic acid-binding protein
LTIALENPGSTVVLDDLAARREADRLEIMKTGTLGLLLMGKDVGIVRSIRDALESLHQQGMRLSHQVIRAVLEEAGE